MEARQFDRWTRFLMGRPGRDAIRLLATGIAGRFVATGGARGALAQVGVEKCKKEGDNCKKNNDCCSNLKCNNNNKCEDDNNSKCKKKGDSCKKNNDCCNNLRCNNNNKCEDDNNNNKCKRKATTARRIATAATTSDATTTMSSNSRDATPENQTGCHGSPDSGGIEVVVAKHGGRGPRHEVSVTLPVEVESVLNFDPDRRSPRCRRAITWPSRSNLVGARLSSTGRCRNGETRRTRHAGSRETTVAVQDFVQILPDGGSSGRATTRRRKGPRPGTPLPLRWDSNSVDVSAAA